MTAKETYQSLKSDANFRIKQKLDELNSLTSDDAIATYRASVEELSVQDGKYPGTGGIRTFITGRDKLTYDFIDLDKYYISDEVDQMLEEEKSEREAADQTLQDNIDAEEERAKEAEKELQDNIDAEEERAESAEADLQQQINDETTRATAAEEDLQNQLNNEIDRATSAEKDLQNYLDEEISQVRSDLATESDSRVEADDALRILIEALQDKLIYFGDHFVCKSNDSGGYLNWDKDAGIYIHDYNYGDAWINAAGTDSIPLLFAVTIDGTTYQYCIDMKTGYAYYRYGDVGEGSLADIQWISVDSDLQNQITNEIENRESADEQLVDWSKQHFIDTITVTGHSPLTLEASESWNSSGYKTYTIDGTVDCYSKDDVKEIVDGLELNISSLQAQINAITSTRVETVTDINASGTSPLTLSANKSGNVVTITGSVDLTDYYTKSEITALLAEINSSINIGLDSKQDVLTAGTGIDITNNIISCTLDNTVFKIVEQLPTSDINTNVIYVVIGETTGESGNLYSEYIYVNGKWEKIGEFKADTDLSDYYTKSQVDTLINDIDSALKYYYTKVEVDNLINSIETTLDGYQEKLEWYSEGDDWAQISLSGTGQPTIIFEGSNLDNGIHLFAENGSIICNTNSLIYNNCEVATQCWVQDYVASTSSGGGSVYPTVSTSIPTSVTLDGNKLYTGSISSNTNITFSGSQAGAEAQLIIYANSTVTVTLGGGTVTDGYSSISVAAGKYLEVNAVYDGNTVYIRSGYSE